MKRKRVTYGVYNLVELHARLSLGKATVKVAFTGGAITTLGITPATHTTSNPIIQLAIENSPEFRSGKIKIVRTYPLEGEVEIERNPVTTHSVPMAATDVSIYAKPDYVATGGNTLSGAINPVVAESNHEPEKVNDDPVAEESETCIAGEISAVTPESNEAETGVTKVEVHCNDDAKDYLEAHFGVKRSTLMNRAMIQSTAAQHKVEFVFV